MHSATSVREHRRGERERGELRRAEVADDRGVDEQVERLGRQRAERGEREAQDLAVVGRAAHAGHSTIRRMVRRSLALLRRALRSPRCGADDAAPLDEACTGLGPAPIERALARAPRPGDACPYGHAAVAVRAPARAPTPTCRTRGAVLTPRRRRTCPRAARRPATPAAALRARLPRRRGAARRAGARRASHAELAAPHRAQRPRCSTTPARASAGALARGAAPGEAPG